MLTGGDMTVGSDGGISFAISLEVIGGSVDSACVSVDVIVGSEGSFIY